MYTKITLTSSWKRILLTLIPLLFLFYGTFAQLQLLIPRAAVLAELIIPTVTPGKQKQAALPGKGHVAPENSKVRPNLSAFITADVASAAAPAAVADGSILLVTSAANPFSQYTAEILTAEGFNGFRVADISEVTADLLANYEAVIVGDIALPDAQVNVLTNWTNEGGTLVALSPDAKLAPLLGLSPNGGTMANSYLLVNTSSGPGKGIVNQTIQYKGSSDLYTLNGATAIATLYSGASTSTNYPAVTTHSVGTLGGKAVAFTYDLAKSVVYLRQGNPEWAGQERDGQSGPIRANDLFYPDWVDLNKVAIPQADEQQRLLANIILQNSEKPLPRFWYLPRGLKAAVVMTGDDHGNGGTKGRFEQYLKLSDDNSTEAVADWKAIRGTSYIYPGTPITNAEAKALEDQGFEIALHLNTNCGNYTSSSLTQFYADQLGDFKAKYTSLAAPATNRTHCIAWSDWDSQPKIEANNNIRLDANYYYWPEAWLQDRPGLFTGSGMPMRFASMNGQTINCYQVTTQMTDESGISYSKHISQLLDNAIGAPGYYGTFCANMHTDNITSEGSDAIIAAAKARNVPVISSKQLLTWLEGRNGSSFNSMTWSGNTLNFTASIASGARNIEGMLPMTERTGKLVSLTTNGAAVGYRTETIKGVEYAIFNINSGTYVATYDKNALPNQAPSVAITAPVSGTKLQAPASVTITAEASDAGGSVAKVEFFNGTQRLGEALTAPYTYNWSNVAAGSYSLTAKATDNEGAVTTSEPVTITVAATCPCTVFSSTEGPAPTAQLFRDNTTGIQLGMKFKATVNGSVTGVRFYKQAGNTGTHTGELYSSTGTRLAQVEFKNETESGWQEASFAEPVAVTAGTTYVISYHSGSGYYSATNDYFTSQVDKTPLLALADGAEGANGVYLYTASPALPVNAGRKANYWVDAVFTTATTEPGNTSPTIAITSPAANASFTAPATITIAANAAVSGGTIAKVEFYNGTTLLGEDLESPYSYTWTNVMTGTYQLIAKAITSDNKTTTSNAVTVQVTGTTTPGSPVSIKAENELPGNPEAEWQISGAGDRTIQGFATDISYNRGETARFKIKTDASAYTIKIYRLGYYQGNGARFKGNATVTATLPQTQPACITNSATGLLDCGNWSESASWAIPADAVSGIYIAKLTKTGGGSSHIVFIVRDDASTSDLLFQTSDATWQAYNVYGDNNNGRSLYTGAGGKAVKVSYNRPFVTRDGGGGGGAEEDWLFNAEYPMIRWLEANGYNVTYTTNVDSDRRGNLIANHRVFLSVGHDEYWSGAQRTHVTNARNSGTNLAFFSGNEVYWKTRWENSIDGNGVSHRTLVCYKEGAAGENTCNGKCDPSSEWTGLWRTGCEYKAGDPLACNPENELSGQISWAENTAPIQVPSDYKNLRFWRNTSIASLGNGQSATLTQGTIGYEWNPEQEQYRATYPKGRIILSKTIVDGKVHHLSLYRHSSGAWVFGAGTVQWSWGLDSNHDRGSAAASPDMQQATVNLFADMGVQPASLQSGLVPATASTDTQAPITVFTSPANNATLPAGKEVILSGTATDAATVAGVEISTDGGTTWKTATGTTNWTFAWTPTTQGPATIQSRSFDDSGNMSAPVTLQVTIGEPGAIACPCSIFQPTDAPALVLQRDPEGANGIQLGMRFKATVDGYVTGVRFYKQEGNSGTHIGQLYNSTGGTALAEVTFQNETAAGWQEATFANPVAIKANTVYVISYFSSAGYYSAKGDAFVTDVVRTPLIAPASTTDAGNGLFKYTSTATFPTVSFNEASYFVDVVFNTTVPAGNTPPAVTITSPVNNTQLQAPATIAITANATDTDGTVQQVEFFNGTKSLGTDTDGTDGWNYSWSNVSAGNYSLTAKATDNAGAITVSEATIVTVKAVCPCTVFNTGDVPNDSLFTENGGIQLGMKFTSAVDGYVTGVRFYKHSQNTGTHTGQLYSSTGALLAGVTFANETATGWQEAAFTTPVEVKAGTTYIISYHSSNGTYSASNSAFGRTIDRNPLRVLSSAESGGNGVYAVSGVPAFPTNSYKASNYWVDVVFNTTIATPANTAPTIAIIAPANNATFTAPASVTIAATAADADGEVKSVAFYSGENKIGDGVLADGKWAYTWNNVATGTYSLTAKATDNKDAVTTSEVVSITVNAPENKLPVVSITAPADGATYTAPATIAITASATDADGEIDKVEFYNGTTKIGDATLNADKTWSYAWTGVGAGTYSLKAIATDKTGGSTTSALVAVSVSAAPPVNAAPVVSNPIPDQQAVIGTQFSYSLPDNTFSDADKDALTYTAKMANNEALPAWLSFTGTAFSGTPPTDSPAALDISVTAADGKGGSASDEFRLTISKPANRAPVLATIADKTIAEGSQLSFQASATDADEGNILIFTLENAPTGAAITANGAFTWTPAENQDGEHSIKVKVSDGSLTDEAIVKVTVTEVNRAPVLAAINNKTVAEGSVLTFTASATDADVPANRLSYSLVGAPTGAAINPESGAFAWTPTEEQNGTHTFTVKVTDNGTPILSDSEEITVTVTEGNSAPVLTLASVPAAVQELTAFTLQASATDPDKPANTLTFSLTAAPEGAIINATSGLISWTPTEAQGNGNTYNFTVQVSDGALTDSKSFTLKVEEVNVAPVLAAIGSKTVVKPNTLTFTARATDADIPANNLVYSLVNAPAGATINSATGAFSWAPAADQSGSYTFSVKVSDGALTDAESITVTVTQQNTAPVLAAIGNKTAPEGNLLTFKATATDADLPADKLTYALEGTVPEAKIDPATGVFTWTPSEAHGPGKFSFTISVSDGALRDEETIQVQVSEVNQAPLLAAIGPKEVVVGQTLSFTLSGSDKDLPAQKLTYSANKLPAGATLNAVTGIFQWKPGADQAGSYKINFKVSDGIAQATQNVTIEVTRPVTIAKPVITRFTPTMGNVGQRVSIYGSNFNDVKAVYFNNVAAVYAALSPTYIVATVPAGATTGKISVSAAGGTAVSSTSFIVTKPTAAPVITKFSPTRGAAGAKVLISGSNLTTVTKVSFGSNSATFSHDGKGNLEAIVPKVLGRLPANVKIKVTSPAGSYTSKDWFTILELSYASSSRSVLQATDVEIQSGLTVYPNPAADFSTVNFTLAEAGDYTLNLYDERGVLVRELKTGKADAGEQQTVMINGTGLAKGLYFIRLESKSENSTVKLLIEK
ncbi:DUF4082 domain-containing protein [Pontibacter sp. Tf4]|uniref:DUF4082 domain-containing protein n=1 Tax=Pontibacter sp. Tf4 TaxID=2761620 RepID=UPI001624A3D3|nr:DUF4082 domain-containing protein [Pontibacter sp. Tf4]MBB6612666.1 DUF4082 domain-containing protein [Pontibacter sp. Tf4]